MASRMSETYFIEYKNTEIEIGLENKDKIRVMFGSHFVFVTPAEADTLAVMLAAAAEGKDVDDYEAYASPKEEEYDWDYEDDLGEKMW